jgi:hypothetical protein
LVLLVRNYFRTFWWREAIFRDFVASSAGLEGSAGRLIGRACMLHD